MRFRWFLNKLMRSRGDLMSVQERHISVAGDGFWFFRKT